MENSTEIDNEIADALELLLARFKANKPSDRSEKDRRYAIVITELEKARAYFHYHVIEGNE